MSKYNQKEYESQKLWKKKHPMDIKIHNLKHKLNHPETIKKQNVTNMRLYRSKNEDKNREYNKQYMSELYHSDPVFKRCHNIRTRLTRKAIKEAKTVFGSKEILNNLKKLDKRRKQGMVINHIISISLLVKFDINLDPVIICDNLNLEVVTKEQNLALRNFIDDRTFEVARKLQEKFPVELKGLISFLRQQKMEIDLTRTGSKSWKRIQKNKIAVLEAKIKGEKDE